MTMAASGHEKRRHKRIEAAFGLVYSIHEPLQTRMKLGMEDKDAIACDLSEGGLAISTSWPVPVGAVLNIRFRLVNSRALTEQQRSRSFKLRAEVRYMIAMPDRSYRIGLRFWNASEDDRRFISYCV